MPGVPTIFANLLAGTQPLSLFDQMFNLFATLVAVPCTAAGANTIILTPIGQSPIIPAYQNFQPVRFQAVANSTGAVTAQLGGLAALPVYQGNGTTQATTGSIIAGKEYLLVFAQSLNASAGGWYLEDAGQGAAGGSAVSGIFGPYTNIAAAGTTDLTTSPTIAVNVTGAAVITSFGSSAGINLFRILKFAGINTLTHNASSLFLPNAGNNIVTAANDSCLALQDASGNWKVVAYQLASGNALQGGGGGGAGVISPAVQLLTTSQTITIPANATKCLVTLLGGAGGGGGAIGTICGGGGTCPVGSAIGGPGGGGAGIKKYLSGLSPGLTMILTIGAAGAAGSNAPGNGGNGGSTILASGTQAITTLTAGFGSGGGAGTSARGTLGTGGVATNGDLNIPGGVGFQGALSSVPTDAIFGLGTSQGNGNTNTVGNPGSGFGAGGSGGVAIAGVGYGGGTGTPGVAIFEWFA